MTARDRRRAVQALVRMRRTVAALIAAGLLLTLVVTIAVAFRSAVEAYAFNDYDNPGCRWGPATTSVYYTYGPNLIGDPNYTWRLRYEDSVANWNQVPPQRPQFVFIPGVSVNFDSYTAIDGLYGFVDPHCSAPGPGNMIWFDARVNSHYAATDFVWNDNALRSITGHELGHGLGLGHSSVTLDALMHPGRDHYTVIAPRPDDISGLRALYP